MAEKVLSASDESPGEVRFEQEINPLSVDPLNIDNINLDIIKLADVLAPKEQFYATRHNADFVKVTSSMILKDVSDQKTFFKIANEIDLLHSVMG